jgi:hypothetical protein
MLFGESLEVFLFSGGSVLAPFLGHFQLEVRDQPANVTFLTGRARVEVEPLRIFGNLPSALTG